MKKKIIIPIIFIFAILIILAIFFLNGAFDNFFNSQNYVLKIGDINISKGEYKVYLYEQKKFFEETGDEDIWETDIDGVPAEEVAKQNAINSIASVKSSLLQAERLGITLSDDDLNKVSDMADKYYSEIGDELAKKFDVTYDDIYDINKEWQIQNKVFEYITDGFKVDEKEFDRYFEEYCDENKPDITNIKVKYIFKSFDKEKNNFDTIYNQMKEIRSQIVQNSDLSNFDTFVQKYSEIDSKSEIEIKKGVFEGTVEDKILELTKKGQISDIVIGSNGFYIFYVTDYSKQDINTLKESKREEFYKNKKEEFYRQQSEKWTSELTIEKNNELFSTIKVES